jgi:hypothetical protein
LNTRSVGGNIKRSRSQNPSEKRFTIRDQVLFDGKVGTVVLPPAVGQSTYLVRLDGEADLKRCSAEQLESIEPEQELWWPDKLADWIIERRGSSVPQITRPATTKNGAAEMRENRAFQVWRESDIAANIERDRVLAEIHEALRTDRIPQVKAREAGYGPYFDETTAKAWAAKHFYLEGAVLPPDSPESRRRQVDSFLAACSQVAGVRIYRKHIWRSVGHQSGRQFQHWQAMHGNATKSDERNFSRQLSMKPEKFIDQLKSKGLFTK